MVPLRKSGLLNIPNKRCWHFIDYLSLNLNYQVFVAIVYALRSSTNFMSASLTHAYTISMIQMLGVFVMAGGSWLVLHEKVPWYMWIALTISVFGSGLVIAGQSSRQDSSKLTHKDVVGICLQTFSLFFSTCSRLQMRTTEKLFTSNQFMRAQYVGGGIFSLLWCVFVTGIEESYLPWTKLKWTDWTAFFFLAIGIHFIAVKS
eukprot:m.66828 g.66828  ORF g.66828 m.66828 type:complete len:203 (+) comp11841_c0_seq3:335-943(+)